MICTDSSCKSSRSIRGPWNEIFESRDWVVCPVTVPQEYDPDIWSATASSAAANEEQAVDPGPDTDPPAPTTSQRLRDAATVMQNASEYMQDASRAVQDVLGDNRAPGGGSPPASPESRWTRGFRSLKSNLCRPTSAETPEARPRSPTAAAAESAAEASASAAAAAKATATAAAATEEKATAARPKQPAPDADWWMKQSATQLSIQYGETLDWSLARCDSLYALHRLIEFSITSQSQQVTLCQQLIAEVMSNSTFAGQEGHQDSIYRLQLVKDELAGTRESLSPLAVLLLDLDSLDWPRAPKTGPRMQTDRVAKRLTMDIANLVAVIDMLSARCHERIQTLASADSVRESARASNQATKSWVLSWNMAAFAVLGTVAAIFGQNFRELGSGHLSMWWFAVACGIAWLLAFFSFWLCVGFSRRGRAQSAREDAAAPTPKTQENDSAQGLV